jgi:hypothetical protein
MATIHEGPKVTVTEFDTIDTLEIMIEDWSGRAVVLTDKQCKYLWGLLNQLLSDRGWIENRITSENFVEKLDKAYKGFKNN